MNDYLEFVSELFEAETTIETEQKAVKLKENIIKELIVYRNANSLTQAQFAQKIGVKQQAISRFERGDINPRLSFIIKVLQGMEKTIQFVDSDDTSYD